MDKIYGYKSKALIVLNIVFIITILLTLTLFVLIGFIDLNSITGIMLGLIFIAWCYLPLREIKNDKDRLEVVLETDKYTIEIRDLKNNVISIKLVDISNIKISKLPFLNFGTITFYTQLRKVTCRYVKDVNNLVNEINKKINL